MSEAELLQLRFAAMDTVLSVFSMFFGIVSAYIAGLYFFLHKAPWPLRMTGFALLTAGFIFLGNMTLAIQRVTTGIIVAWSGISDPVTRISSLKELEIPDFVKEFVVSIDASLWPSAVDGYLIGILLGWVVTFAVYAALAYMTFVYRWAEAK